MLSSNSHKETIAAFEKQLQAAQDLLQIQQNDALHREDHIQLLNGEIDMLRNNVQIKQDVILNLQHQLHGKNQTLELLNKELDQLRIDKLAIYTLEEQVKDLEGKIKQKDKVIADLHIEVRFLQEKSDDLMLVQAQKAARLNELEIIAPYNITRLEVQLQKLQEDHRLVSEKCAELTAENAELHKALKWNEDRRIEQVARAQRIEYAQLLQLDQIDQTLRNLEVDQEALKQANSKEFQRGQELLAQLQRTVRTVDEVETACGAVVTVVQKEKEILVQREKRLLHQNLLLQGEKQILGEIVERGIMRSPGPRSPSPATLSASASPLPLALPSSPFPSKEAKTLRSQTSADKTRTASSSGSRGTKSTRAVTALPALSSSSPAAKHHRRLHASESKSRTAPTRLLRELQTQHSQHLLNNSHVYDHNNNNDQSSYRVDNVDVQEQQLQIEFQRPEQVEKAAESEEEAAAARDVRGALVDRIFGFYIAVAQFVCEVEENSRKGNGGINVFSVRRNDRNADSGFNNEDDDKNHHYGDYDKDNDNYDGYGHVVDASGKKSSTSSKVAGMNPAFLHELSLHELQLQNADSPQIIAWLRRTDTQHLRVVNLSGNQLGGQALYEMAAWLLSLPMVQLSARTCPLRIDFRKNKIKPHHIEKTTSLLQQRSDFTLVAFASAADQTLCIFAAAAQTQSMRCVAQIDVNQQRSRRPRSSRGQLTVRFDDPPVAPLGDLMDNRGALLGREEQYDHVFPRNYLIDVNRTM
eukprot:gene25644-30973_t